jgi:radical SAM protein with 4Fe4S-binding SPASM domain
MEFDAFKKIIDEAWPYVDSIGLTGLGEPLLHRELESALRYVKAKNAGIITSISTNASLPDAPSIVERLVGKINTIQISVDGIGETFSAIRRGGDFDSLVANVRRIIDVVSGTGVDVMFNMVVTKENYHQMADVVCLAHELGVPFVHFTPLNLAGITGIGVEYYEFFKSHEFTAALHAAKQAARRFPEIDVEMWDFGRKGAFRKCPFPYSHFYITWEGYVVPCCAKPFPDEMCFGNVFESSLMSCLNSDGFMEMRRMWYANTHPAFCDRCHFIYI